MSRYRPFLALLCILLCKFSYCIGQTNYIRIIDIDSLPQHGKQLMVLNDMVYINFYSSCDSLRTICSGIMKVDVSGEVINWNLLQNFSTNKNALIYDDKNMRLIYTGEAYRGIRDSYKVAIFDPETLDSLEGFSVKDSLNMFHDFNQNTNDFVENKLIISGSAINDEGQQVGLVFYLNGDFTLDTLITLRTGSSSNIISTQFNDGDDDVFYLDNANSGPNGEDLTTIVKVDRNTKKIVWNWTSEPLIQIYRQLPYGFLSPDNQYIISKPGGPSPRWSEIWSVKDTKEIAWKFKFPYPYDEDFNPTDKQKREIYRLREAGNGDILGCGVFTDYHLTKPVIKNVPYIFRMSKDGHLLWERAFHNTSENIPEAYGYMSDIIEMEDGDLLVVGTLYNFLQYDPIIQQERVDPDILLVRLNSNGCVNGDCSKIMNTNNVISASSAEQISSVIIYPNPNSGTFEIVANTKVGLIEIFSLTGDQVFKIQNPSQKIDLSFLPNGVYSCRIFEEKRNRFTFVKIIIAK